MGLFDKILGEFVDVIEWTDQSKDTMVYRFERYGNEIKYGAMLTVRESQIAILISEGRVADVFKPGLYRLETRNMPILTTLQSWSHAFSSPFKAEVYFFNMKRFTDLKWGTKNPIMMRDKELGPVRLRAFGTYAVRIQAPERFIQEIVGTNGHFSTDDITDQLRNFITSRFGSILGDSSISILDLAGNYDDLSSSVSAKIGPEFLEYGLEVNNLLIENISLPEEVEKALDKRTSIGITGNLDDFTRYQAAEAMQAAAENSSGTAAAGVGMGVGFGMATELSKTYQEAGNYSIKTPPLPQWYVAVKGDKMGPFALDVIQKKILSGEIKADTLVWHDPLPEWLPAEKVDNLVGYFLKSPPPLPKA